MTASPPGLLRRMSFQKKIYLSCFILNLLLLLVCSVFFYSYTLKSLRQSSEDSLVSNTTLLVDKLDMMISNADNSLKSLQTNDTLIHAVKKISDSPDNYFSTHVPVNSVFKDAFLMTLHSNNQYGSISYLSNYYDNVGVCNTKSDYNYLSKKYLKENKDLAEYLHTIKYVDYAAPHTNYWGNKKNSFSIIRSMRTIKEQYGLLIFDFDEDVIKDLLSDFSNPDDHSIIILDKNGDPVYGSDSSLDLGEIQKSYQTAVTDGTNIFSFNDDTMSCFTVSPLTGWTFILNSSTLPYMNNLKDLIVTSALLFLILAVIMSSFLYFVTRSLVRPMNELVVQLEHTDPDSNIQLKPISAHSTNEIVILTNVIQGYLAEIYEKTLSLNESRRREFEAHYAAMEAQLNPHFLYNTLSVIGMTGLNNDDPTVFQMCSKLASLLRYSLSYTGQSVELGQEIANAKSYLYIMKIRYENDFSCTWELDPVVESIHVPKLILQPIIENCFQHGFRKEGCEISPPWKIRIRSWCDEENWYLSISNNGQPFDPDVFSNLQKHILHFKPQQTAEKKDLQMPERQGYGLENTVLRLSIYYDGNVYFNVTSDAEWVSVIIGGPIHKDSTKIGDKTI